MEQVPELADSLPRGQGAPLGRRSKLQAWTEAGPIGKKGADRPDGWIEVRSSRGQRWVALLEAKIGKASLDSAQIDAYLAEARAAGADALITVSNDFAVLPDHHPTYRGRIGKALTSSMTVGAPEDRKTARARVTWLLRRLTKTREEGVHVRAMYGRRGDVQEALVKVREDPAIFVARAPRCLRVAVVGRTDRTALKA